LVLQDLPVSATPLTVPLTNVIYLRFHGTEKGYHGSYDDKFLSEYAQRIRQWMREGNTFTIILIIHWEMPLIIYRR